MVIEVIILASQKRHFRDAIENLLVLLIGGIPIAMPTVLSVTMAIGSHRLSQQVQQMILSLSLPQSLSKNHAWCVVGCHYEENDSY